jgi:hypothetical protein
MTDRLTFPNGTYYVPKPRDVVNSLFIPGGTASGTYRKGPGGVTLFNLQGEPFAFIVDNRHSDNFIVSCSRLEDGRVRYMFSTTNQDERALGLDQLGYMAEIELARRLIHQLKEAQQ